MGIQAQSVVKGFGGGWTGVAAKPCDSCKAAPAAVYCRPDSAFLCLSCDSKIHAGSRHGRVWLCEVCEQAPAAVMCRADAAALCVTCDADIHSANPLARRHERVPVQPFFDSAESVIKPSLGFNFLNAGDCEVEITSEIKPTVDQLFFTEMDSFIDFHYPNPTAVHDSVVPVQATLMNQTHSPDFCKSNYQPQSLTHSPDFCKSNYQPQSLTHSVSCSSLDVGVVPEANSMSDLSYPLGHSGTDSGMTMPGAGNQPTQLVGLDREARVLRYREKRKNRKFEKTIRYASRKAYAETRPRIKGRFAKRTEMLSEVEEIYGSGSSVEFLADFQYGVVPTF